MLPLLPTTLVGSYAQPDWLIDREKLGKRFPRACAPRSCGASRRNGWSRRRTTPPCLPSATRSAPASTSSPTARCAARATPTASPPRSTASTSTPPAPRSTAAAIPIPCRAWSGPIRRRHPVQVRDVEFLRRHTAKPIKITVPGPFTMSQQAQDDYYKDEVALALDYAAAVNVEIEDLFAAGADIVQVDEPYMQARPDKAKRFGVQVLDRALAGIGGTTAMHICFGYAAVIHNRPSGYSFLPELEASKIRQISIETAQANLDCSVLAKLPTKTILLGVLDLSDMRIETPEAVAARIRRALPHVPPQRLVIAPDCGLKYLPRDIAYAKMQAMAAGAAIVRRELCRHRPGGTPGAASAADTIPLRRRQRLRRERGGRTERHGLSSPPPSVDCTPTSELSPMAFLVGVRLCPQTPPP